MKELSTPCAYLQRKPEIYYVPNSEPEKEKVVLKRSELTPSLTGREYEDDRHWVFRTLFHCHGDPERCFWFRGKPLPLCSRCLSFYTALILGFLLGSAPVLLFDLTSKMVFLIFVASWVPLALDGTAQYLRLTRSTNLRRSLTGGLAGAISGATAAYLLYRIVPIQS